MSKLDCDAGRLSVMPITSGRSSSLPNGALRGWTTCLDCAEEISVAETSAQAGFQMQDSVGIDLDREQQARSLSKRGRERLGRDLRHIIGEVAVDLGVRGAQAGSDFLGLGNAAFAPQ